MRRVAAESREYQESKRWKCVSDGSGGPVIAFALEEWVVAGQGTDAAPRSVIDIAIRGDTILGTARCVAPPSLDGIVRHGMIAVDKADGSRHDGVRRIRETRPMQSALESLRRQVRTRHLKTGGEQE